MLTILRSASAAIIVGGLFLAGCSTSAEVSNPFDENTSSEAQLAAFAASSQFPNQEASNDLTATALVHRDTGMIQIINASNKPLTNAKVWVNGQFVTKVNSIPANGSVRIPRSQFYDQTGRTLSGTNTTAQRIQLQTSDNLYNLQGPVFD